eukprot:COSAG01_NODE_6457_length_3658_cov_12.382411_1_plen_181_part_10
MGRFYFVGAHRTPDREICLSGCAGGHGRSILQNAKHLGAIDELDKQRSLVNDVIVFLQMTPTVDYDVEDAIQAICKRGMAIHKQLVSKDIKTDDEDDIEVDSSPPPQPTLQMLKIEKTGAEFVKGKFDARFRAQIQKKVAAAACAKQPQTGPQPSKTLLGLVQPIACPVGTLAHAANTTAV